LALAQDRHPRQPRLKGFEAQPLEEPPLVAHGHAPLGVVVFAQQRVAGCPQRPRKAIVADDEAGGGPSCGLGHAAASRSSRTRLAASPPRYPPRDPSERSTRWQGTMSGIGLVAHAEPTARTAFGLSVAIATS